MKFIIAGDVGFDLAELLFYENQDIILIDQDQEIQGSHHCPPFHLLTRLFGHFVIGAIVLSKMGLDFMAALGVMATCLGNVEPGIGGVGLLDNFA